VIPGCSVSGVARAASRWLIEHSPDASQDAARCRVILFELEAADHSDDGER
jgi:hypothetical protein